jgi:hypothetical protein
MPGPGRAMTDYKCWRDKRRFGGGAGFHMMDQKAKNEAKTRIAVKRWMKTATVKPAPAATKI